MTGWALALTTVGSCLGYAAFWAATAVVYVLSEPDDTDAEMTGTMLGFLWPLTLSPVLAYWAARTLRRSAKRRSALDDLDLAERRVNLALLEREMGWSPSYTPPDL